MQTDELRGARAQERFRMHTASIIDPSTLATQSHIVLTWWSRVIAGLFLVFLLMILGLLALVYLNNQKIHQLEIKVDESTPQNINR